jgi:hypothetical protein
MRRAQLEIQFNWIYVAVVGGLILLVFLSIASGIRKTAKTDLEIDAINYFDEIFTSLQGSENTEQTISLPGLEIDISSEKDNCYEYSIGNSELGRRKTEYVPIFSPDIIKGKILSYALALDVPFRSSYLLYLTSPQIAYVFKGNNPSITKLYDDMPNQITKKKESGFENQNYYKIRYITFDEPGSVPAAVRSHNDVSLIRIMPGSSLYETGQVIFYKKSGSAFEEIARSYYFDKPTLFAAIYSETSDSYECNLNKAIMRMNKMAYLLQARTVMLQNSDLGNLCNSATYGEVANSLKSLAVATDSADLARQIPIDHTLLGAIQATKETLVNKNIELGGNSCPKIY